MPRIEMLAAGTGWFLLALSPTHAAQGTSVVTPAGYELFEANSENSFPFDGTMTRTQQAYNASELVALSGESIARLSMRLDGALGVPPATPVSYPNLRITLSTGADLVNNLSTDLDLNLGVDALVVFDGPYTIPTLTGGSSPAPFDLAIDLTTPFLYQGGDLLVQFEKAESDAHQLFLDAYWSLGDQMSRAYEVDGIVGTDSIGIVTRFETAPPPGLIVPMTSCTPNAGTLDHVSGAPVLGATLAVAMNNGQANGVLGLLAFAVDPPPGWPPCGLALPGVGELLLDPIAPNPALILGLAAPWSGAPQGFTFQLPAEPSFLSQTIYAQGLWADLTGVVPSEPLRLTGGLAITIGN